MRRFIAARVAHAAIVVAIVTTIAFVLLRLAPGDAFSYENPAITPAIRDHWRQLYGYDRPPAVQFVKYVSGVARGDLGFSHVHNREVTDILIETAPRTLMLALVSLTLATIIGVGMGVFSAARHRKTSDRLLSALSVVVYSIPEFWLALLIQLLLGSWLDLFPISGFKDVSMGDSGSFGFMLRDRIRHMAMPALTLTILIAVVLARYQRAAMIDVLPSDFLRTARAKGASERTVLVHHALRNALTPTITMLGLLVPSVLGGIFFIEYVFGWQGLGLLGVTAVNTRDYDLATSTVILSGVLVAAGSLFADVATAVADPRVRDA